MKTTLNAEELKKLRACKGSFDVFYAAHGEKDVKLSKALDSNGWNDAWWYLSKAWEYLTKSQQDDIQHLGCDWADSCLHYFEKKFPDDKRPRLAIEAKRNFISGNISEKELAVARSAACAAAKSVESTWSVARSAAWAAAESVESARSVAESAAIEEMQSDLRALFVKWESEQ